MTPLAQALVNAKIDGRLSGDIATIADALISSDCHCFECSAVQNAATALFLDSDGCWRADADKRMPREVFLPSPLTWIEFTLQHKDGRKQRQGHLMVDDGSLVRIRSVVSESGEIALAPGALSFGSYQSEAWGTYFNSYPRDEEAQDWVFEMVMSFHGLLAMINTPRIIGRREHMPHAGLQRRLARDRHMPGKYPLRAWHEIVLEVRPPVVDDSEHEVNLTGQRALHFVRCHLRIKLGRLELVSAHWRGDAALGIKRARYVVVPEKRRAA